MEKRPALGGQLITAEPLHCQRPLACAIVEKGGDYLPQIKGHQPKLLQHALKFDVLAGTPFLFTPKPATAGCKPGDFTPSTSKP